MNCRPPESEVECHMMLIWWCRFLEIVTGWPADELGMYSNACQRSINVALDHKAMTEWLTWAGLSPICAHIESEEDTTNRRNPDE